MTAPIQYRGLVATSMLVLLSSCTVSCKSKEAGAKENAESLKPYVERMTLNEVSRVTCPPSSRQKKGSKFDCQVSYKDGKSDAWEMEWVDNSLFRAWRLIPQKEAEKDLEQLAVKRGTKVKSITCPKRIVFKAKTEYTCTVVDATDTKIEVRLVIDDKGKPRWIPVKKQDGKAPTTTPSPKPAAPAPGK